jgi:hypothetical protein
MPVHTGKDSKSCFAQWGGHGKKYYYTCGDDAARGHAVKKAEAQGRAAYAHGYRGNSGEPAMLTFQCIVSNLKPLVRQDSMEGRDWTVVPTQMITEGVHNGSDGPILYLPEELSKLPTAWNHMPVVVYHPVENGMSVSARTPEQLTSRKIGVLMNTKWDVDNKKLSTETWLDPARIIAVDNRVAEAIENNQMMEVSTGLFMNLEKKEGEWNGENYIGIARNIQPDHLAILPDQRGACSIADGAGFLRVNAEDQERIVENRVDVTEQYIRIRQKEPDSFQEDSFKIIWISRGKGIKAVIGRLKGETSTTVQSFLFKKDKWTTKKAESWVSKHKPTSNVTALVLNEISHEETRRLLQSALRENDTNAWVEEVHDKFFIYETQGKLYKQEHAIGDGIVSFVGLSKLVERKVTFAEVTGLAEAKSKTLKGNEMDKKAIVDALIENERTSWTEDNREQLMGLDDAILANMAKDIEEFSKSPAANEKADGKIKAGEPVKTNAENPDVGKTKADATLETVDQYIAKAPPEIRESLRISVNAMNAQKAQLVKIIMANERNKKEGGFTEEHLKTMDLQMLRAIANLATDKTDETNDQTIPLYVGQGETPASNSGTLPEPLPLPAMNFEQQRKSA